MSPVPIEPRRRSNVFRWGFLAGFLFLPLMYFGARAAAGLAILDTQTPAFDVQVLSAGADVSRAGGAKLQVRNEGGVLLTQICNGSCDDLNFEARMRKEDVYNVRVLDAANRCVACEDEGQYVDGGYGESMTQWRVAGTNPLRVSKSLGPPNE